MRIEKGSVEITSIDTWYKYAPPVQKEKQWKHGRSAMELARAWFPSDDLPVIPTELTNLLASIVQMNGIYLERGVPEYKTYFDEFGGPRNHDLVLWGKYKSQKAVVCVEAKADEPFGVHAKAHVDALAKKSKNSNGLKRYKQICQVLFGNNTSETDRLRYQLLTGVIGTLAQARKDNAGMAIFIVHEFIGCSCKANNVKRNNQDLDAFISVLSKGCHQSITDGKMVGPIYVLGSQFIPNRIPLFVGKCTRDIS